MKQLTHDLLHHIADLQRYIDDKMEKICKLMDEYVREEAEEEKRKRDAKDNLK